MVWTRPWMRNLRQQLNSTLSADGTSRTWCPFLKGHITIPPTCVLDLLLLPSSFHIPNNNRLATPSRKGKRNRRRNSRPHRVNVYTFAFVAPAKSARHAPVNNIIGYHRLFDTTPSCIQVSTIIFQPRAKISSSIFHWNEGANSFF